MTAKPVARGCAMALGLASVLVLPQLTSAATVALWHMDETSGTTMLDSAGGNHGTLSNVQLGHPGFQGGAYGFSGVKSIVSVPSSASLNPGSAPFTVTAYVKTGVVTSDDSADVVRKGLSTNSRTFWKMELQPNRARSAAKVSCFFKGSRKRAIVYSIRSVADGAWHAVQCVKQSASISVVVDGQVRTKSVRVGSIRNRAALAIGSKTATDDLYSGLVDEVSIQR